MMRYKFVIPALYIVSTLSLFSEEDKLGDILLQSGEKKRLLPEKHSNFIFKDTYNKVENSSTINNNSPKKESEKYVYENKSRFKFKFTPGTGYNNIVGGQGGSSSSVGNLSSGSSMSGSGQGGSTVSRGSMGQGKGGRRR